MISLLSLHQIVTNKIIKQNGIVLTSYLIDAYTKHYAMMKYKGLD